VTWAKVWVKLQNHAAGGITDKDFELARKIEDVVLWKPTGGALEEPQTSGCGRSQMGRIRAVKLGDVAVTEGTSAVPQRVLTALFGAGPLRYIGTRARLDLHARITLVFAEEMRPEFAWQVAVLRITVAALMTTAWIARFLSVPEGTELVLIPGLCEGDTALISEKVGVEVEKGPKDLREIPQYFGRAALAVDYGSYDIEILAEINNALA
jgi:hypothetical protein